ncbi:MAG: VanW family protein [Rhodanobacter sp.]
MFRRGDSEDAGAMLQHRAAAVPGRRQAAWFWLRVQRQLALRACRNCFDRSLRRWPPADGLIDAPVLTQSRTPLWDEKADANEFVLVAGKVHNLRIAARALHAIEVPAGAIFSFWQQLGRPAARRGFVRGREIREGCVVPTIAGGICQISNLLAAAAVQSGFELVERHAHSARIEHVAGRGEALDATVFWNYRDLRIRAPVAWRMELTLDASELRLTIRAAVGRSSSLSRRAIPLDLQTTGASSVPSATLRGCLSCEETSCFRHQPVMRNSQQESAWLLDVWTSEFSTYLGANTQPADRFLPWPPSQWRRWLSGRSPQGGWAGLPGPGTSHVEYAVSASLRRAVWLRRWAGHAGRRQASVLDGQRWLAGAYARRLRPAHTHLLIDQGLLPYLHQLGVLGGRSYDVLATALPMGEIQRRLDLACRAETAANATLSDFRADPRLLIAEMTAMRGARRIITAHAEVARYWHAPGAADAMAPQVLQLPWTLPSLQKNNCRQVDALPLLVFPASALARKGAYELATALRGLSCRLLVLGTPSDDAGLWQGVSVEYGSYRSDWLAQADLVVLPAHVEHAPRAALAAIACGIPVIATPACGLQDLPGVIEVPAGDGARLRAILLSTLPDLAPPFAMHDAPTLLSDEFASA